MTGLMFISSDSSASVEPSTEAAGSRLPSGGRSTPRVTPRRDPRSVAVRSGILAALIVTYGFAFTALYARIGSPAFLPGLALCLVAAVLLGLRGAMAVIVAVMARCVAAVAPGLAPDPGVIASLDVSIGGAPAACLVRVTFW